MSTQDSSHRMEEKPRTGDVEGDSVNVKAPVSHEIENLAADHRQYLMDRHGSLALEPVPSMDPADPYNWPRRTKIVTLILVAFHAMMGPFTAAVQQATYLTSLVIAFLGGAPLFWKPLSNVYGRRPIFLIALICSMAGNIGCGFSPTYGTMALCRAITAFFISPAAAIGSAVVSEMFFKHERATFMGAWTIMVTLGIPIAPFLFGFVALRVNYRWIYFVLAITNFVQFVLHFFFGPETLYRRDFAVKPSSPKFKHKYFAFGRINPDPLSWRDFLHPFVYFTRPVVFLPAMSYAMIFLWAIIMTSIEIPSLFPELFGLNTQQVGLQFLAFILGSIIGEQIGGRLSDYWMNRRHKATGTPAPPEWRLWLSYLGQAFAIIGVIVFLIQTSAASSVWNITPLVGACIGAVGNQLVTTVYITYAVDCYKDDAAGVGVFITFVRQIWGELMPRFPQLIEKAGLRGTAGVATAMMVIFSVLPTLFLQFKGRDLHRAK